MILCCLSESFPAEKYAFFVSKTHRLVVHWNIVNSVPLLNTIMLVDVVRRAWKDWCLCPQRRQDEGVHARRNDGGAQSAGVGRQSVGQHGRRRVAHHAPRHCSRWQRHHRAQSRGKLKATSASTDSETIMYGRSRQLVLLLSSLSVFPELHARNVSWSLENF